MFVDGDAYRVLVSVVYLLYYLDDVAAGLQQIAAGFDVFVKPADVGESVECGMANNTPVAVERVDQRGVVGSLGDVDAGGLANGEILFADKNQTSGSKKHYKCGDDNEYDVFAFHDVVFSRIN